MSQVNIENFFRAALKSEGKEFMQARQFFKDQVPWPEGVYQEPVGEKRFFIDTPDGVVELQEGDWIVAATEGEKYYVRIRNETVE